MTYHDESWADQDWTDLAQCPRCEGVGAMQSEDGGELEDCRRCSGTGLVSVELLGCRDD